MKNLIPKSILQLIQTNLSKLLKHISFAALLGVLLAYILVVWQISHLATAEPDPGAQAESAKRIPKIDQKAINQIQALEQNNTEIHSLFNQVRNNPFQE
jgi:hypothetical protein